MDKTRCELMCTDFTLTLMISCEQPNQTNFFFFSFTSFVALVSYCFGKSSEILNRNLFVIVLMSAIFLWLLLLLFSFGNGHKHTQIAFALCLFLDYTFCFDVIINTNTHSHTHVYEMKTIYSNVYLLFDLHSMRLTLK